MARGFTFRLDVVRKIRRQAQDEQRRVVAEAVREVKAAQDRIERASRAMHDEVAALRDEQKLKRLDMALMRGHRFYMSRLHREIGEARILLGQKQDALAGQQAKLAEASKQLKVIEKLKERRWNRYKTRIDRTERADEDEVALQGYMRGHAGWHGVSKMEA